ncbi:hypothetical protein [Candidatus Mycoplasma haematohominis]|nr:hypothetical protein [Candidatus Mycoplasma haemohominis]
MAAMVMRKIVRTTTIATTAWTWRWTTSRRTSTWVMWARARTAARHD